MNEFFVFTKATGLPSLFLKSTRHVKRFTGVVEVGDVFVP